MTSHPNIVLVTVDSLRADHCSFMGSDAVSTPTLDGFAAEGALFSNAVAPGPSTPESMPAVFTGHYPVETIDPTAVDEARATVRRHMQTRATVAERVSRRGYATAGFTPNPYTSRYFGFDAGFDYFEDFTESAVRTAGGGVLQRLSPTSDAVQAVRMLVNLVRREEVFKPWESFIDAVTGWIEQAASPYFVWVHTMDPHVPYMAPASYRELSWWRTFRANVAFWRGDKESGLEQNVLERLRGAYADTVRYTDAFLDRLASETDDNTAFLVHADHGEAFGEHGIYGHEPYLFEENIHVPLVVSGVPSTTVERPTSLRELPVLIESLADCEWNPPTGGSPFAVSRTASGNRVALRGRRVKYIRSPSGTVLYDLARGEQQPLTSGHLETLCQDVLSQYDAGQSEYDAVRSAVEQELEVGA